MATLALIHGAWHGSWCWDRLTPLLHSAGHRTVAVDLPCDDPSASFEDYAQVVVRALESTDDSDVFLVAHSLAGITAPLVAYHRPVQRIFYVSSLLAAPGGTLADRITSDPDMLVAGYRAGLELVDGVGTTRWSDEAVAQRVLFQDCDAESAHWAFSRLRPQATAAYGKPLPVRPQPDVPCTYVICADDQLVNPDWSRRVARDELGATVVELPGGHSPFLSRPEQLAAALVDDLGTR